MAKSNDYTVTAAHQRLKRLLDNAGATSGGFKPLAADIGGATNKARTVERRKLSDIVSGKKDVRLGFLELEALDAYLRKSGVGGLSHVFRSASLLEVIAEQGPASFFLGFKPDDPPHGQHPRTLISHWDLRSVVALLHGLYQSAPAGVKVDIEEVFLQEKATVEHPWDEVMSRQPWYKTLETMSRNQSLIAIGSPKACHAAEQLLAMMFNTRGFRASHAVKHVPNLPFQFEWTADLLQRQPSSFASLSDSNLLRSVNRKFLPYDSLGLRFRGEKLLVRANGDEWTDYGVVVAQRRAGGQIWMVCAGLSGPATYAAAELANTLDDEVFDSHDSQGNSSVMCRAVEAIVETGRGPGDNRQVIHQQFVGDPFHWRPQENRRRLISVERRRTKHRRLRQPR